MHLQQYKNLIDQHPNGQPHRTRAEAKMDEGGEDSILTSTAESCTPLVHCLNLKTDLGIPDPSIVPLPHVAKLSRSSVCLSHYLSF